MTVKLIHTCVRVLDIEKSIAFYRALGFEERGRLNFDTAYNVYMGLPGDGDSLELTVNEDRSEPYDLGDGYNHVAVTVEDIGATLEQLEPQGIVPETPPFHPGDRQEYTICFVTDPDGYRIELIDGGAYPMPQDPRK